MKTDTVMHDDVMTRKRFARYWPFMTGIHRWPVDSLYKGPVIWSFRYCSLESTVEQSICREIGVSGDLIWRHYNFFIANHMQTISPYEDNISYI